MTDHIDLDEMDVGDDEADAEAIWHDDGAEEIRGSEEMAKSEDEQDGGRNLSPSDIVERRKADENHAPGVPKSAREDTQEQDSQSTPADEPIEQDTAKAHGTTEPAEMTMAMTYKAAHYFEDPQTIFGEAQAWAEWLGMVGEVSTPVIKKFQRDHRVELDFFGGKDTGPVERLADIDETSMFNADRLVLVGVDDDDEWIADEAGWEFVPVTKAAEKADWELNEDLL